MGMGMGTGYGDRIKACLGGGYKFIGVAYVQIAARSLHRHRLLQKCGRVTLERLSPAHLGLNAAKGIKTNY